MNKHKYILEISCLLNFGSFLVVFLHALTADMNYSLTNNFYLIFIYRFVYNFIMPLFIFLSGFLFVNSNIIKKDFNPLGYIKKRFRRLIIPYFWLSSIAFIPKAFLSRYAMRPLEINFASYINSLIYPWQNPLILFWFLPTIFIISTIAAFLFKRLFLNDNKSILIMLVLVFFCLNIFKPIRIKLLNLQGVLHYLIYFWLGCLFPIYKDKYRFLYKKIFFISSFLTSLCLTNYILRYTDCLFLDLVKMVTAVIGIAMMMSLVLIISRGKNNFLSFMNGYAYQIFLLHWFV